MWYDFGMTKTLDPKTIAELSRYTAEELDPQTAEDEAAMEAFLERNREAVDRALQEGIASLNSGKGVEIRSLDDLLSVLSAERARRGAN